MRPILPAALSAALLTLLLPLAAEAQPMAPSYEECRLDSIFPNGGRRGTTVEVEFRGTGQGLAEPRDIVVDGPPGIKVKEIKSTSPSVVMATLEIAPDAPLGRRWLRVLNERSGLTNFAYFMVGDLPETKETEPNDDARQAHAIQDARTVVNGRIQKPGDLDVFRFPGVKGSKFVGAIAAHALDVHGQGRDFGIADFSLELLTDAGQTLAIAEDSVGFDPIIEHTLPADGDYLLRVQLVNYGGYPEAVYRLTIGDAPYPLGAFPAGVQRGSSAEIELFGLNMPAKKQVATVAARSADQAFAEDFPVRHVSLQEDAHSGLDVPLIVGELPESVEAEPNDEREKASRLNMPGTINARFNQGGDVDWYRIRLEAKQQVWVEIYAHRFLRSPVDTKLEVYDADGKLQAENDDEAFDPNYESYHDFKTTDSRLTFTAAAAGEYFVKVTEQTSAADPRAIYRLTVKNAEPDYRLTHFPDAVPIWGPGSTACVLVRVDRFAGCDDDIELAVEGLPAGWTCAPATSLGGKGVRSNSPYQLKQFLSITAPADAEPGTCLPFRVVGRSRNEKNSIERTSIPLTLFFTSDTGFFRISPVSRVAVAKPQGPWLEAMVPEVKGAADSSVTIPVRVHNAGELKSMPIVVNLATSSVACAYNPPQTLPIEGGIVQVPLKIASNMQPGTYGITVAQTWRSDIRIGMPGPSTKLISLIVGPH